MDMVLEAELEKKKKLTDQRLVAKQIGRRNKKEHHL